VSTRPSGSTLIPRFLAATTTSSVMRRLRGDAWPPVNASIRVPAGERLVDARFAFLPAMPLLRNLEAICRPMRGFGRCQEGAPCRDGRMEGVDGRQAVARACAMTEDVVVAAKNLGINVLPTGACSRTASWRCFRMTSSRRPRHMQSASTLAGSALLTRRTRPAPVTSCRYSPEFCALSYPLPLREAMQRLVNGISGAFCKSTMAACVHAHCRRRRRPVRLMAHHQRRVRSASAIP